MTNLDDLELELRKLPGVRAAGFTERDDVLLVQVHVAGDPQAGAVPLQATRIACRHSDKPVTLEVVRWRVAEIAAPQPTDTVVPVPAPTGEVPAGAARERRVRLLAVLTFPDTDELEVHLTFEGRRIIGRASASDGALGVVEAAVDGLRAFVDHLELTPAWARELEVEPDREQPMVACQLTTADGAHRTGIATGASAIEAAARATLHALNRVLAPRLAEAAGTA
ncbi:MAG: hypothetical protein FJW88_01315 [Actinobacteria bacterium]|nr:hypothetical protein [Actinomycetota bacterium]